MPYDLVLMAGQSNMSGYAVSAKEVPRKWHAPVPNSEIWVNGRFVPLQMGAGYQNRWFGPELSFAKSWTDVTARPLRIVKIARPATSLAVHWKAQGPGARLYNRLITTARAAMAQSDVRLCGALWMQGESDAQNESDAQAYAAHFRELVARLRMDLGAPILPFVAGLVSAPAEPFPFIDTVRAALAQKGIKYTATIETRRLERQPDRLHLTGPGLLHTGRRFGTALARLGETRPAIRRWLWQSEQYQAWYEGPAAPQDRFILSFPHADNQSGFQRGAFAQRMLSQQGHAAIHLRINRSNWFQDDEIFDVAAHLRKTFPGADFVTFGSSMGAYGALLLSGALNASRVIAVSPQFSIDRSVVPWETRWSRPARRIGAFRHDLLARVSDAAQKHVFYDPMDVDRKHIDLFPKDVGWDYVPIPFGSHELLQRLLDHGVLEQVLDDPFGKGPDGKQIAAACRGQKRDSLTYWKALMVRAWNRRPALALSALEHCINLGAPRWKFDERRQQLLDRLGDDRADLPDRP